MKRTALVTGGNRGIGKAVVAGLAEKGYTVLLGSRNLAAGIEAAADIDGDVYAVALNVADRQNMKREVKSILQQHPQIDVLVNNAAILQEGSVLEVPENEFDASMRVNVAGPFDLIRLLVPGMISRGYGRIVNVSSQWGSFADGLTGPAAYSISKAAINALTVTLARSLPANVKVNSAGPGWVKTRMGGSSAPRTVEQGASGIIWLATLPDDGPNGGFFQDGKPVDW
ncbi:MAG: SDR family NAD(P)-dependent oxidoreductase [Calditrichota bacterium]